MRNIKTKKRQKNARLVLTMAVALSLPIGVAAQGLFQRGVTDEIYYGLGGAEKTTGMFGNRGVQTTGIIDNQTFGQEVPLDSGIIVILAVGAGYAVLRRKEEKL